MSSTKNLEHARALLRTAVACDLHSCPTYDPASGCLGELLRYRDAGVRCVSVNVGDSDLPLEQVFALAAAFRAYVESHPTDFALVGSVAEIADAANRGKLAIFFDLEGAYALGTDLKLIPRFHELGVRWMALVYNTRNQVGGGCHDAVDEGLTPFGREMLAELDRVGIIKDCSHAGYRTAREILEWSAVPAIFSHSNALALTDHPRNIPDELIRLCAERGGVIGINGIGIFLGDPAASTPAIVRHLDYVAQLVGPQHVAIALDCVFDVDDFSKRLAASPGIWPKSAGYSAGGKIARPEQWPEIVDALCARGYSDDEVRGIVGENFLRVARAVWRKQANPHALASQAPG